MNVEVNCQSHAFLVNRLAKGVSYFTFAIVLQYFTSLPTLSQILLQYS